MDQGAFKELEELRDANRDLRHSFDQLSALQGLSSKIIVSKSYKDIIDSVFEVIPQIINCFSCQIFLFQDEKFKKIGEAQYNPKIKVAAVDEELMYWSCRRGNVSVHPGEKEDTGTAIAPLTHGDEVMGAIVLDLGEYYAAYSEVTGLSLHTIANHTSLAISNYQFHTQLEDKARVLHDTKEYVDRVIASIAHSIISFDPDGKIKVFNRKAEEFFEIRSKLVQGQVFSIVLPDFLASVFSQMLASIQAHSIPEPVEVSFKTHYNQEKNTLITASPLNISGASKPGMVCVCQDLALSKEVERLKELDKMKDDFISMVSHELKTPLASILAYSETLLEGLAETKEEEKEYYQVIFDEGNRLGQLVNDILDLSKIESGKMTFNFTPFAPQDLVERGVISAKKLSEKKKQKLVVEVEENLPMVIGDYERLTQVILNLVSNAVKFTPNEGTIYIGAMWIKKSTNQDLVRFIVEDNGIGINPEDHPKVFDKFTQIEDVMNHSEGTGLGMPISREIVRAHESDLLLESQLGKGARFWFDIKTGTKS